MTPESLGTGEARAWRERLAWSGLKRFVEEQEPGKLFLFLEGQSRVLETIARSFRRASFSKSWCASSRSR